MNIFQILAPELTRKLYTSNCVEYTTRSILGPLFSLLHINDITRCLNKTKPRLFADDTNLTSLAAIIGQETAVNFDLENLRKVLKQIGLASMWLRQRLY